MNPMRLLRIATRVAANELVTAEELAAVGEEVLKEAGIETDPELQELVNDLGINHLWDKWVCSIDTESNRTDMTADEAWEYLSEKAKEARRSPYSVWLTTPGASKGSFFILDGESKEEVASMITDTKVTPFDQSTMLESRVFQKPKSGKKPKALN